MKRIISLFLLACLFLVSCATPSPDVMRPLLPQTPVVMTSTLVPSLTPTLISSLTPTLVPSVTATPIGTQQLDCSCTCSCTIKK